MRFHTSTGGNWRTTESSDISQIKNPENLGKYFDNFYIIFRSQRLQWLFTISGDRFRKILTRMCQRDKILLAWRKSTVLTSAIDSEVWPFRLWFRSASPLIGIIEILCRYVWRSSMEIGENCGRASHLPANQIAAHRSYRIYAIARNNSI